MVLLLSYSKSKQMFVFVFLCKFVFWPCCKCLCVCSCFYVLWVQNLKGQQVMETFVNTRSKMWPLSQIKGFFSLNISFRVTCWFRIKLKESDDSKLNTSSNPN